MKLTAVRNEGMLIELSRREYQYQAGKSRAYVKVIQDSNIDIETTWILDKDRTRTREVISFHISHHWIAWARLHRPKAWLL